jgi:hypothetical protein
VPQLPQSASQSGVELGLTGYIRDAPLPWRALMSFPACRVSPAARPVALAVLALGSIGCAMQETPPTGFCTAPAPIAVEVTVTDSVSGQALADSASGSVETAGVADSLHHITNSTTLLMGGTRLGNYTVTVSRPGYATWQRSNVSVTQTGPCGNVLPVALDALLQPVP